MDLRFVAMAMAMAMVILMMVVKVIMVIMVMVMVMVMVTAMVMVMLEAFQCDTPAFPLSNAALRARLPINGGQQCSAAIAILLLIHAVFQQLEQVPARQLMI